jgi:hypothetical protein
MSNAHSHGLRNDCTSDWCAPDEDLTPEGMAELNAAIKRTTARLQAELDQNAEAIGAVLFADEADMEADAASSARMSELGAHIAGMEEPEL